MTRKNKKVVLLIVEGSCDETLLIDRLRVLFSDHDIRFEPQHGDIMFDFKNQNKPIKEVIGDTIKRILIKRKFKASDILAVLHIIDTDGCLIHESKVVVDGTQECMTHYQCDSIRVPNETQQRDIRIRNELRSKNIRTMNSVKSIYGNKLYYQMYYFSRNLEHVIFDEPNPTSDTKLEKIELFIDSLDKPIEEYLQQYIPTLTEQSYEKQYLESWNFIAQGNESLNRFTTVPLMFKYIELFIDR